MELRGGGKNSDPLFRRNYNASKFNQGGKEESTTSLLDTGERKGKQENKWPLQNRKKEKKVRREFA